MAAQYAGERPGYTYTRYGNPTIHALEEKLAGCAIKGSRGNHVVSGFHVCPESPKGWPPSRESKANAASPRFSSAASFSSSAWIVGFP